MDIWFTLFVMTAAVIVAVGGALLLVSYLQILPASFEQGWQQFLLAVLLPIIGPLWFAYTHRPEFERPGKQLLAAAVLLLGVGLLLYFWAPFFVDRMLANLKTG